MRLLRSVLLMSVASFTVPALGRVEADTVFLNGAVWTGDAARSEARAVAVRGERIVYVGTDAGAQALAGEGTRIIDLQGRTLLPGFQDSHAHPGLVPDPARQVALDGLKTAEALRARIRDFAAAHPELPWIIGNGWDEAAFLPEGRPTRAQLDDILPERPAFLVNNSQHQAWVNSAALKAAGISRDTPQPENGEIVRDAAGEPTGSLQETAMMRVRAVIPPLTAEERADGILAALGEASRLGITTMQEAAASVDEIAAYRALERRGPLPLRLRICQRFDPAEPEAPQIERFLATRKAFVRDITANCVKILLDGGYGSRTVALLEPYVDDPHGGRGETFVETARLRALVTRLDALDFNLHVHAIGDRTVREALDAIAAARRANGYRGTRHALAHLSLVDPADVPRFRALGVAAAMTPLWSRGDPWQTVFAVRMFGPERAGQSYRTRGLLDAGAVLAWGSDWPVTGVSPLAGLETAVTHRHPGGRDPSGAEDSVWNPAERLSLPQALAAWGAAGAWLLGEEHERGSIAPGMLADLVVLDRDLFSVPPLEIHSVNVDMTLLGGRVVHERQGAAPLAALASGRAGSRDRGRPVAQAWSAQAGGG